MPDKNHTDIHQFLRGWICGTCDLELSCVIIPTSLIDYACNALYMTL
jgi:hypothetical protein